MGKIAFVFSGQGDQYPGMGKELCEKYSAAAAVYSMCDRLRPGTSAQCFEGTEDELKDTRNTQPCLFAMELAAASVLMEKGIEPKTFCENLDALNEEQLKLILDNIKLLASKNHD